MEEMERVAIVGVTGFVGRGLPSLLAARGIETTGVSRAGGGNFPEVKGWQRLGAMDFAGHQAVINLAGERIDQRWTERKKQLFHESRVGLTGQVVAAIGKLAPSERPRVLVNASAVGFYGDGGDEELTEAGPEGDGYLAGLCSEWEEAAMAARDLGVRVVVLRIGIVLGREGAAFRKLRFVFKAGIGGRLGSGRQWMPWVHVDDLRAAIMHAVVSESLVGPVNGTAPFPERNRDFTRKLAAAVRRPAIFPVPGVILKLALGGFGGALLAGQKAVPAALARDGFSFRFPTLEEALRDLV